MKKIKDLLLQLLLQEQGASAVEYSLLISLIAMVIFAAIANLGTGIITPLQNAAAGFGS